MLIHKLILQHLKHQDDPRFYLLQAQDAIAWIERQGVSLTPQTHVLDLGCGHGIFGRELAAKGCLVTYADEADYLHPELKGSPFKFVNLDQDDLSPLGQYDLVICSNVLEHLSKPARFIESAATLLKPGGRLYLSWTNWLSPWGGHEFSPFHYLGVRRGHLIYDKLVKRKRNHTPFENLFPTYIGETLDLIHQQKGLAVCALAPRYYTEFAFLMRIPVLREFLAWNCAMLIERGD